MPDKYYVSFPYGVYDPEILRPHRKDISSERPFMLSHKGKTVQDNEYLGFTFDKDDFDIAILFDDEYPEMIQFVEVEK